MEELNQTESLIFWLLICPGLARFATGQEGFSQAIQDRGFNFEDIRITLEVFVNGEEVDISRRAVEEALVGLEKKKLIFQKNGIYQISTNPEATSLMKRLKNDLFSILGPENARICG